MHLMQHPRSLFKFLSKKQPFSLFFVRCKFTFEVQQKRTEQNNCYRLLHAIKLNECIKARLLRTGVIDCVRWLLGGLEVHFCITNYF